MGKDSGPPLEVTPEQAPWSEVMRGNIEAFYGTADDCGSKVLDLLTASVAVASLPGTYNYEVKIRLFAEEGISLLDCTEATCVRYLAWLTELGSVGAGSV
eukprot:jgi/Tetstr1/457703/TSEL_044250.t1